MLLMLIKAWNRITTSCGNSPVVAQNVSSDLQHAKPFGMIRLDHFLVPMQ